MMHEFLTTHRLDLIARCRAKVALRTPTPGTSTQELEYGIAFFLDQLIKTLRVEQGAEPRLGLKVSGPSGGDQGTGTSEVGETAARHGRELLEHGFTVDQVVHDYGDLCQAVTDLAVERAEPFDTDEFRTLNRCLDNAIADAVTEFGHRRELFLADAQTDALNHRLGAFAHELRNLLNTATLALHAIQGGDVGLGGATGAVLDRSLVGMHTLIDRSLSEARMTAGLPVARRLFSLAGFITEVKLAAALEARVKRCVLLAGPVDPDLAVDADHDLLAAAVGNLLQNAFKFTRRFTEVTINAYAAGDRVLIEVGDHCGGLPPGDAERMFLPFTQNNTDRSGLGLGLSISRRSVEANGGTLRVCNVPGTGCVFTIDLPRHVLP